MGYNVLIKDVPVKPHMVRSPPGSILRNDLPTDGCCGHSELIKLHIYGLVEHRVAVYLDLDALVLQPLDELFDCIVFSPDHSEGGAARSRLQSVLAPTYVPPLGVGIENMTVDAFYTKDYNMMVPSKSHRVGVQGGFLVVRTDPRKYVQLVGLILSGEFYPGRDASNDTHTGSGWFHSGYGKHIWGSMTIQGLLAYYYDVFLRTQKGGTGGGLAVELNRCAYNQIGDNPRTSSYGGGGSGGIYPRGTLLPESQRSGAGRNVSQPYVDLSCRDGRDECDDVQCQTWPMEQSRSLHFTYCKAPWKCVDCGYLETYVQSRCYEMHREWFRVRSSLEEQQQRGRLGVGRKERKVPEGEKEDGGIGGGSSDGGVGGARNGEFCKEYFLGYCRGEDDYIPMVLETTVDNRTEGFT